MIVEVALFKDAVDFCVDTACYFNTYAASIIDYIHAYIKIHICFAGWYSFTWITRK
jgi:hypothetical protein